MFHRILVVACGLWVLAFTPAESAVLFPTNSTWKYFKGRSEASSPDTTAWRAASFDDSSWEGPGAHPFFYGESLTGGTQFPDMNNLTTGYNCIFMRRTFVVSDPSQVAALRIVSYCDDGFIAWINGREVQRYNFDPNLEPLITSTAFNANEPVPQVTHVVTDPGSFLVPGNNVIAVQLFNTSRGSSDIVLNLALESLDPDPVPPTVASKTPAPGDLTSLTQVTVRFSENVQNVDASDFLINGAPLSTVSGSGSNYTFTFPQPSYGQVQIGWSAQTDISDFGFPPNRFDPASPGASWQYNLRDNVAPTVLEIYPPSGAFVRALSQLEIVFSEEVTGVEASDLRINNQPAGSVSPQPGNRYVFGFTEPAPGSVQVAWASGHGITDLAATPNAFGGGSWSYTLDPNASGGDVIINEFMAANENGITDENGEQQDWIELYNRGSNTVDLTGWSLSDDPDLPGLWTFPLRALGPGQYLIIFASGKDRKSSFGTNHTNFRLGVDGEHLGLYSADAPRVLVSSYSPYPEQRNDHSYGFDPSGQPRYFAAPTPGRANGASSIVGVVEPVHFSVQRGFHNAPFDLHLSTPTPGAEIRYTTDATVPTATSGTPYNGPLRITNTVLLRAAAFRPNFLPSSVGTHSYLYHLTPAQRTLPVFSLVTALSNWVGRSGILGMFPETGRAEGTAFTVSNPTTDYHNPSQHGIAWERPVSVEYIEPAGNSGFQIDCGIRVMGSDWQRPRTVPNSKFSFRLYFRGDYGKGRLEYPLFPLTQVQSFDQIVLRAGYNEKINPFIRDEITRRLSHDMGQIASHGGLALVLRNGGIHTNDPGGSAILPVYNPCERVHSEMLQSYFGGGSEWDVVAPEFATSAEGNGVVDGDRNAFGRTLNAPGPGSLMSEFWTGTAVRPITTEAAYTRASRQLDLVNFVDYCLLNMYVAMGDWPANNWRAARERSTNGIWRFIAWDAEWAMGIYSLAVTRDSFAFSGTGTEDAGLNSTGNSEIARIYQALRPNPEFRLLWADRIHKHFFNNGALTGQNITNRFNELGEQLRGFIPTMDAEILMWARDRPPIIMGQFNTYGLYGYSNALYGVFASSNAPALNQHGGRVTTGFQLTMTAPLGGTIYYTTNGSDPRVPFAGAVSDAAVAYSGPLTLTRTVPIKARTLLNGTNWSAIADVLFEVDTLGMPLRVTEIMYNPSGGSPYEFVEVQNVGARPLNIGGVSLDGAVSFTIPEATSLAPGATIVIANSTDPAAFAARYPGVSVAGYFDGNLNNGGERLMLKDRHGNIIVSVDYDDGGGWPREADGAGFSLEIVNAQGDPDAPANWRASAVVGGSPGVPPAPAPLPAVRLNEILAENAGAFSNYVELRNTTASSVDLSGWSLTDDGNERKFVLPQGTSLPAGGFLVLWCDRAPGALHTGFELARSGVTLRLFDAATNRIDALTYGAQLSGYSLGFLGNGWDLNTPTPGSANTAAGQAAPGNVVLNEWLANPVPGEDDWLELYNRASSPVSLKGFYIRVNDAIHQINLPTFLGPHGYIQLFAGEQPGAEQLDLRLPAAGATVTLYDAAANQLDRLTYSLQTEGVSQGRLPDGSVTIASFPGSTSPGASNYVVSYTGPYLNEVLARNRSAVTNGAGQISDFVEIYNPTASAFNLGGMSLSLDELQPRQWVFPANTMIPASGYLVLWCNSAVEPSTTSASPLNTGNSLEGDSGSVYLFNAAGHIVSSIQYGAQVENQSIGRVGALWRLLSQPTPGATNSAAAALAAVAGLRINEWLARPISGPDWFEIYNPSVQPVDLNQILISDELSFLRAGKFRPAPLTFMGARGFARFIADENQSQGRHHVNFNLQGSGEGLRLSTLVTNLIDIVSFGSQQPGVSQGRLPDGTGEVFNFPGSASPGESNYLLAPGVRINEVLANPGPGGQQAVELSNASAEPVPVGGWYLSDSSANYRKYRIPDGTTIPGGGFLTISGTQFNDGSPNAFALNASRGGEIILSVADAAGVLSGQRAQARYGASLSDTTLGPITTSVGVDFSVLAAATVGSANAAAKVGPVVISEIMYNPLDWINPVPDVDGEYIELENISSQSVSLFDPANPANRWRLGDAVEFTFPPNTTLDPGERLLVVNFNPAVNVAALTEFRQQYGLGAGVTILGPYRGKLSNGGDNLELYRPGLPEPGGFVPSVLVDRVNYSDAGPWPSGNVDGGGLSLQKRSLSAYGNEPLHWVAAAPTPSALNGAGIVQPPSISSQPQDVSVNADSIAQFSIGASGGAPLQYQWRHNREPIDDATNTTLSVPYVQLENEGTYDVVVSNPAGSAISRGARLQVSIPPVIFGPPQQVMVRPGNTATFTASVRGSGPLTYRWFRNGVEIPNAVSSTLSIPDVQPELYNLPVDYTVSVSNRFGVATASAMLFVLVNPVFVEHPRSQFVRVGETIALTAVISNTTTLPLTYRWRKNIFYPSVTTNSYTNTFEIPDAVLTNGGLYAVVMTNEAVAQVLSAFAYVTVVDPPSDQTVDPGQDVTLRASALGTGTLRYQWLYNGTPIIGATTTNLVLTNVQPSQAGIYTLLITNVTGGNIHTRYEASLSMQEADTDGDGMPDSWESANGLRPDFNDALADADGDGMTNRAEYIAGTDPQDDDSYLKVDRLTVSGAITIEFTARAGKTYTVQYTDDLNSGVWSRLSNVSAAPNTRLESVVDPSPRPSRFYRLITPRD